MIGAYAGTVCLRRDGARSAMAVCHGCACCGGICLDGNAWFHGFVAELQILLGAWSTAGWMACVGGIGIVLGAVYTLKVLNQVFFSSVPATREVTDAEVSSEPTGWCAGLLMIASLVVGVYPRSFWIDRACA